LLELDITIPVFQRVAVTFVREAPAGVATARVKDPRFTLSGLPFVTCACKAPT
jgi:hypothetical protein